MSFPPFISALKLNVSMGTSPNVQTFEQPIHPSELSGTTNSVLITENEIVTAFDNEPLGTIFSPSIVTTYEGFPSGNILPTPSVSKFVPRQITPTLSIESISNKLTTDDLFPLSVTSPSNGLKIYSCSDPDVASVDSLGIVTPVSGGTTSILFFQAASDDGVYTAAGPVSTQLIVNKAVPALSISSISNKLATADPFPVSVTGPSNGIKTYSSSHPEFATIDSSSGLVTLVSGGTTTITVSQAASDDGKYTAAGSVSTQLVVDKAVPALSIASISKKLTTDNPFPVSVTGPSNGIKTYSSSHPQVASIDSSSGLITLVSGGTTTITVLQAASDDGVYTAAGPVSTQLIVDKAVPVLSIASIHDKHTTDYPFSVSVTSPSNGLKTYSSSESGVATIDSSSGLITLVSGGTTTITVSQAASHDGKYAAAGPVSVELDVDKAVPILSIASIDDKFTTDDPFYVSVTTPSNGLKIYSSSDPDVASVDLLGQVTPVSDGTTSILFFQAASNDGVYTAAGPVSTQLIVNKAVPALSISSIDDKLTTDDSFYVSVTGPSNGIKTYSSSHPQVATIDSLGLITLVSGGTTTITVLQAASDDGVYDTAGSVSTQLVVNKAVPALSISSISNKLATADPFPVSVTTPSNGLKIYSSSDPDVASVDSSSGLITLVNGGTTTIFVSQAASDDGVYATAGPVSTQLVVDKTVPNLYIASIDDKFTTDDPFYVSVTSPSNGLKTYSSSESGVATIDSLGLITLVSGGTTTITVSQAASHDGKYAAAGPVSVELDVDKAVPALSIDNAPNTLTLDSSFPLSVTSPSDGLKIYSSSDPDVASVDPLSGQVTSISGGTTTIFVFQAASLDGVYTTSELVLTQLVVDKAVPALSIASISNKLTTDDPFSVSVTGPSNGLKTYSSSHPQVATIDSFGLITLVGGGTTTITVSQAASDDGKYTAAGSVSTQLVVVKAVPALSIASISKKLTTDNSFPVVVTGPSNGIKTYSSSHPQVATIDSFGLITLVSGGTTTIAVLQAASDDGKYAATGSVSTQLVVDKAVPALSISSIDDKLTTDNPFPVSVTGPSNGIKFYSSSNPHVASIDSSSGLITPISVGKTTITVSQAASNDGKYFAAVPIGREISILRALTSLSNFTVPIKFFGDVSFDLDAPTTNGDGAFTYTSSDESVATVSGSTVTIVGVGSSTITATQAATNKYTYAIITESLFVYNSVPTISNFTIPVKTTRDAVFTLPAPTSNSTGSFSYTSSDTSVAIISGSTVNIVGVGSSMITAIQAATTNYSSATIEASLVVISVWGQRGLDINGNSTEDLSGYSISLSSDGNIVAIGSPFNDREDSNTGQVRVYYWNTANIPYGWSQRGLSFYGKDVHDILGWSVSLSSNGNTLAIGSPRADETFYNNFSPDDNYTIIENGNVSVYDWIGASSSWIQRGSDIYGKAPFDNSGYSVSLSSDGNTVAIGAPDNSDAGSNAGHVRVYYWNTAIAPNRWTKRGSDIDGEAVEDHSGWSVSLSSDGNTVAIGAPSNDGTGSNAGHVRVYYWNTASVSWTKRGSDIDGEAAGDHFGWSVSLSSDGNTVAIGAPYNSGAGSNAGRVCVYDWNTASVSWTKRGSNIDGEAAGDQSGRSVSLSSDGNTVAIGAPFNDGAGSNPGHVRVYDWNTLTAPNQWTKRGSDIDGEAAGDLSGWSVSLSSDAKKVAIGSPYNSDTSYSAGQVRVYEIENLTTFLSNFTVPSKKIGSQPFTLTAPTTNSDGSFSYISSNTSVATILGSTVTIVGPGSSTITATQAATNKYLSATIEASLIVDTRWRQHGLDIDGEAAGDHCGWSVSLSSGGNTVAIGAPDNSDAGSNAGHVRVYDWNTVSVSWTKRGSDIDGEAAGDHCGWSVSLSSDGNTLAIGAPYNSGNSLNAGHVRVYDWNTASVSWTKRGSNIDGEAAGDHCGHSVSLSSDGNTVAIGAPSNDGTGSNAGHVRVYDWNTASVSWTKRGSDIDSESAGDYFGWSVSISSNGSTVAIGAPNNDGDNLNAGHVRVYDWNTASVSWTKRGSDIDGEAVGDNSGYSVSLSSDGNTVAIGAPGNNDAGSNSGHVRVFYWNTDITPNKWTQRGSDIIGEADSDLTGWSVSLSSDGNTVAFGAPYNNDAGSDAGQVRVYKWNGTLWTTRLLALDIDGDGAGDQSGYSVSLSSDGNTLVIGAPFNGGTGLHAGHARIYTFVKKYPSISYLKLPLLIGHSYVHSFTLTTDPISNSTGSFSYSSNVGSTSITGRTVVAQVNFGQHTIITATQAESVDYTSGSTSSRLIFQSTDGREVCSIM